MSELYTVMLAVLAILAISGLYVGVTNDAVNFLNAAIGSKVAKMKTILLVASVGIILGVLTSSGMMEVARSGMFNPGLFTFHEIMILYVSVMFANNEIGTIEPIKELCEVAHAHKVLFHTDAVQATGAVRYNVKDLGVDMLSFSGHKFYGPKGIGGLYIRSGIKIEKLIIGGEQERTNRGGTTNVPAVVGMAKALEIAIRDLDKNNEYIGQLHDKGVTVILYGNPSYQIVDNPEAIKANLYKYVDLIDSDHLSKLE